MSGRVRPVVFALGALLLAGSWAATGYVEARQAAVSSNRRASLSMWVGRNDERSGRTLCLFAAAGMATGAAMLVLGFPHRFTLAEATRP